MADYSGDYTDYFPNRSVTSSAEQEGREDAAPTVSPKEFAPLFPNPESDPNNETPRGDVLREAEHLITGDRNHTYGSPTDNFKNIAQIWDTLLRRKMSPGQHITSSDVADLMVAVKLARNVTQRKRDNYTDMAGYAACGFEAWLDED